MEKKFTFTLTEQESNLVLTGLGELPLKVSLALVQNLQKQAQEQVNAIPAEPVETAVE